MVMMRQRQALKGVNQPQEKEQKRGGRTKALRIYYGGGAVPLMAKNNQQEREQKRNQQEREQKRKWEKTNQRKSCLYLTQV